MPELGKELASLDFANLIGGPLNAIVDAQARSAIATANFVQQVGFDKDGAVRNATFRYSKPNADGDQEEFSLTVPFITMLPVPFVKIEEGEIEFNAKLTSTQQTSSASELAGSASVDASVNYWFVKASMKASASYKKTSSATEKVERTYEMRVRVLVKGTDLPAGMERLFGLLENSLEEVPTGKLTGSFTLTEKLATAGGNVWVPDNVVLKKDDVLEFPGYTDANGKAFAAESVTLTDDPTPKDATNPAAGWTVKIPAVKVEHDAGTRVGWSRKRGA